MARTLEFHQRVEQSIVKKYRKQLWTPFITAVCRYELIQPGDKIAVCISGGKDSMCMAKLMQEVQRHGVTPFDAVYLVMDPGYSPPNRERLLYNAEKLHVPVQVFESNVFAVANSTDRTPCYLCAKMRRVHLYSQAQALGCNKIALGHHFNDVIETAVMSMFFGGQLQSMPPKLHSSNFPGMELIRPLYMIHEEDIIAWARYHGLEFLQCACRFTENNAALDKESASKRRAVKALLRELRQENPDIEKSIFSSVHNVHLDTMAGYKTRGQWHSFLERYEDAAGEIPR